MKLYFVLKNGEKDSVQIGTKNPIGNAVFARKDNNSEIFLTNSLAEIVPVAKIDSRIIGKGSPGAVTKKLTELFKDSVKKYQKRKG